MTFQLFVFKAKHRLWRDLVRCTRPTPLYLYIYRSYWHYLFHRKQGYDSTSELYYSARPNPGAGIGHQMANWIAGYWFARQFGLKFAHLPFSTERWEEFLGFGSDEVTVEELKRKKYKVRRLPLFDENSGQEIAIQKKIIRSYSGRRVVFRAEQDQFYMEQYGVMEDIKKKFYSASSRKNDKLVYSKDHFNLAIHVRRGDIMQDLSNPGLSKRYLSNDYFEKVLRQVLDNLRVSKPVHIYFFSQGTPEDYPEFSVFENLHWCLDMNAQDSFLHMVYADLLITSKSSFSYKPALLNNGIKVCPQDFWHGYPDAEDCILCGNDGRINNQYLNILHERTLEIHS